MPTESIEKPWSPDEWDMNGDAAVTIADLVAWLTEAFFLPGDWAIWLLAEHLPGAAGFLELDASSYGGLFSGLLSAFLWLAALFLVLVALRSIKLFDEALTRRIRIAYDEALRRSRMAWAALKFRLRRGKPRDAAPRIEFAEEIDLGPRPRAVLQALLDVPPPYALSVDEIAAAQKLARSEAAELVAQLKSLNFVSVVGGGAYEDRAYAITSTGRAYLLFKRLGAR